MFVYLGNSFHCSVGVGIMNLTDYETCSRDDLLEEIQTLKGKIGIQQKRNERLNNEFKRQERRLLSENRKLKTTLRALGGNSRGGRENFEALRKENEMLRATIKTYHDELRQPDLRGEDETSSRQPSQRIAHKKKTNRGREKQTFEERMRRRTNMLSKRAHDRKKKLAADNELRRSKEYKKILLTKSKKQEGLARSKERTEKAYQSNREAAIAKLHQQFKEDLRAYDENMHLDEEKQLLSMREQKSKSSSNRRRCSEALSIDDIFSRLDVEEQ